MNRPSNRAADQLRPVKIIQDFTIHAEGSVLIACGNTKVLCNASIENKVPRFLKGQNQGWVTAEYGMLPRSTHSRMGREATRGKQSGRTQEIQRLIGRSLRAAVDLKKLGENTITIDCDVLQADGGTRTASITGAFVALQTTIEKLLAENTITENPIKFNIAAVSVGVYEDHPVLDLDYPEDSNAETDMNVVMDEHERFIEIQGTAEGEPFSTEHLNDLLTLAKKGINELIEAQRSVA